MLLGNRADFAIEVMSEPHLTPPSAVWGRMCIHIGELTLGDYSEGCCALYPAYWSFESLRCDHTPLWDNSFNGLTLEQIHDRVRDAIYGDDDRSLAELRSDKRKYGRYDFLTNWGEQFDWYGSVIVQRDWNTVTIMHRPANGAPAHRRLPGTFVVAECTYAGFVDAVSQFVRWFDTEAKRLSIDQSGPGD